MEVEKYSKNWSKSVGELIAGTISDYITLLEQDREYDQFHREESRDSAFYVHPKLLALKEAKSVRKSISDSLISIHFILSELERLICRARLPELSSGELSELEAMGRELAEGFAKHTTLSLKDGRRPFQGDVVEVELSHFDLGKSSFPLKALGPLILGSLFFSTREELLKTELTISAARKQLKEYYREAESFSKALAKCEVRVEVEIENEAASVTSPRELAIIVEKFRITPGVD
jgi:hypothetical protein